MEQLENGCIYDPYPRLLVNKPVHLADPHVSHIWHSRTVVVSVAAGVEVLT